MALSLNANFLQACIGGVAAPRFLVQIYVDASTSYKFLSGKCDSVSYPESLLSISPVTRNLDFITRRTSVNSSVLVFNKDALWLDILYSYGVKGAHVGISLGFDTLVEGDFEQHAVLTVDTIRQADTTIELTCKEVMHTLADSDVYWQWVALHPLQAARRILVLSGTPNSRTNLTTLSPASYTSSISHFSVSRAHTGHGLFRSGDSTGTNALGKAVKGKELLDSIAVMLGGNFLVQEDGKVAYNQFDPTAAATDAWTSDDYHDLEIEPLYENMLNRVRVISHPYHLSSGDAYAYAYMDEDGTSQSDFAQVIPGGTDEDNVKEHEIPADWVGGVAQLHTAFTPSTPANGSTFDLYGGMLHGFCGLAWSDINHEAWWSDSDYGAGGSQNSEHTITTSRPLYLRIDKEIVKVTSLSVLESGKTTVFYEGDSTERWRYVDVPMKVRCTLASTGGRGAMGTTPTAHLGLMSGPVAAAMVYDVTIQQHIANMLTTRCKDGCQVIRCRTGLHKYGVQIGDLITLEVDEQRYVSKGRLGLTTTTKFEVVGKQLDLHGQDPGIQWTLAEAAYSGAGAHTNAVTSYFQANGSLLNYVDEVAGQANFKPHVLEGLTVSGTSGFDVTFASGLLSNCMKNFTLPTSFTLTVQASKDTYVAVDTVTGDISMHTVSTGAGQPDMAAQNAVIGMVESDGSGITDTDTSVKDTKAIDGERLVDATVEPAQADGTILGGGLFNLNSNFSKLRLWDW